ncbi:hypothetical protein R6Q57_009827 [Mikania cordata]
MRKTFFSFILNVVCHAPDPDAAFDRMLPELVHMISSRLGELLCHYRIDSGLPLVIMMEGSTNGQHQHQHHPPPHHHHQPPHHHHHHHHRHSHNFNRGAFVYRAPRHSYNFQQAQRNLGQHSHGKTNPPFKVGHKSESRSGYTERREKASRKQERIRSNRLVIDVVSGDSTNIMCGLCSASTSNTSVVAVLVCGHVYHADCLETRTPYEDRRDPLCPVKKREKKLLVLILASPPAPTRPILDQPPAAPAPPHARPPPAGLRRPVPRPAAAVALLPAFFLLA